MNHEKTFSLHPMAERLVSTNIDPSKISLFSRKILNFYCPDCKHDFFSRPHTFKYDRYYCPFCNNKRLCGNINCDFCLKKSFAYHEGSINMIDKNVSAIEIFPKSNIKRLFKCQNCNHIYMISPHEIILKKHINCSYCIYPPLKLCDDLNCIMCFNNSFACTEYSKNWSNKNKLLPRQVLKSSNTKYIFDCPICNHEYKSSTYNINKGHNCPYCENRILCGKNNCEFCFKKSFASVYKSKYWADDNILKPRDVFKYSEKKYNFICPFCNKIYFASLKTITKGKWCSCTKRKTETKLLNYLENKYNIKIIQQKKFNWCKNIKHLRFDFFLKVYKIIIELDGRQHFQNIKNWENYKIIQKRDIYKMKCANKKNYSIIRIFQEDVWSDKNQWKENLNLAILMILYGKKPINILIGDIYIKQSVYEINEYIHLL